MNTTQTTDLFRQYTDEHDESFLSNSDIELYLELGYNEFRHFVSNIDPHFYATTATVTVSSARSLDLNKTGVVYLGGAGGAGTKIERLLDIAVLTDAGEVNYYLAQASRRDELEAIDTAYLLQGTILYFSTKLSEDLQLQYIPTQNVDWSRNANFIDDLELFHDLIVLYAYNRYAIRDNAINQPLLLLQQRLEQQLKEYLQYGRSIGANSIADTGYFE